LYWTPTAEWTAHWINSSGPWKAYYGYGFNLTVRWILFFYLNLYYIDFFWSLFEFIISTFIILSIFLKALAGCRLNLRNFRTLSYQVELLLYTARLTFSFLPFYLLYSAKKKSVSRWMDIMKYTGTFKSIYFHFFENFISDLISTELQIKRKSVQ
jgi:hypothetical protein